jgi:hypothetical protein
MRSAVDAGPVTTTPWRVRVSVIGLLVAIVSCAFVPAAKALRNDHTGGRSFGISYADGPRIENAQAHDVGREPRPDEVVPNRRTEQSASDAMPLLGAFILAAEGETGMAAVRQAGIDGENAAGINQAAKVRIPSATGTAAYRIPDALTSTTLTEVKNVAALSNTSQLQDFLSYAQSTGSSLRLDRARQHDAVGSAPGARRLWPDQPH